MLSDRVALMEAGRVEQIGRPEEVYRRPATAFVARFLGRANFLAGTLTEIGPTAAVVALEGGQLSLAAGARAGLTRGETVHAVIRQEAIRIGSAVTEGGCVNQFAATVVFHAFAGQAHHYVIRLVDGRELEIAAPGAAPPLARGTRTRVEWSPEDVILLPTGAGASGTS
jgi:ABC-type Fe3+/spermidine/putrescine transport system ATPase subunit